MEAILPAVALFGVFIFIFASLMPLFRRDRLQGKHVFITGGSKGLGLEMAKEFVRRGCDVSILARNQSDLLSALEELKALKKSLGVTSKLQSLSADTGNSDELAKAISTAEDTAELYGDCTHSEMRFAEDVSSPSWSHCIRHIYAFCIRIRWVFIVCSIKMGRTWVCGLPPQ